MTRKELALCTNEALKQLYPDAVCSLQADEPYRLLMATRLSAQCTDARVNLVTRELFAQYPTLISIAQAELADLEKCIHSCGLYKTKARDLKAMAQQLLTRFNGQVPDTLEQLITLPGVGRKTANLILGDVYGKPAVVVDTHCIRISGRIGLTTQHDPEKIEMELKRLLPPEDSGDFCHRIVLHGRALCTARAPKCDRCPLSSFCKYAKAQQRSAKSRQRDT